MAQFVIEFGATEIDPVFNAVLTLVENPSLLDVSLRSGGSVSIPATEGNLNEVHQQFVQGEITSATIRTGVTDIRYGLLLAPHFDGQDLSLWMGTIELTTDDWHPYWEKLLKLDGLVVVCTGEEEGVELTDGNLTVTSFPWEEWPLLIGALRDDTGRKSAWVIRERATAATR